MMDDTDRRDMAEEDEYLDLVMHTPDEDDYTPPGWEEDPLRCGKD
jgi:hypothetical protein